MMNDMCVIVDNCWFCGDRAERPAQSAGAPVDIEPPGLHELPDTEGGELPF